MKTQLRVGSDTKKFTALSFKRAYLLVQSVPNVAGVFSDKDLDLTKLRTTIEIAQAGVKDSTSFDAVGPVTLSAHKQANTSYLKDIQINTNGVTCQGLVADANTLATLEIPLLWGGYILKGDDHISFSIDIIPGFFGAGVDANSSVYLVLEQDADIVQTDINLPVYYPITSDKSSPSFNEKAVSECWYLDSTDHTYSDTALNALEFRSDFINDRFDSVTMAQLRAKDLNQSVVKMCNKFYNVEPSAITDVEINLDVVTANVITGAHFLFVSRVCMSKTLTERAVRHAKKVNLKKASMRGVKY